MGNSPQQARAFGLDRWRLDQTAATKWGAGEGTEGVLSGHCVPITFPLGLWAWGN